MFVKQTYTEIAEDFDDTRYCVWNFVKHFLLDKGSLPDIDIDKSQSTHNIWLNEYPFKVFKQYSYILKYKTQI
jgi:hypothetical protein